MLRTGVIGLLVVSLGVAVAVTQRDASSNPQDMAVPEPKAEQVPDRGKALQTVNPLPISQVVLFNSGVGYFQRSGQVVGDARVDLQFQANDINDLIKSLVIDDAKGKVLPLHYDSQEPIEKTLHSFAINLSTNPSFGQILNQARGEKVELALTANASGLPGTLNGTIVGMESGPRLPTPTATTTADTEFLNLMCAEGLRTVPINQIQRLRFLNPAIENELRRALKVVASGHDSQKKHVRLGFRGEGKREVKVGYVTENPIWKTSYRLVMSKGKTKLLGWANIENTSDEDWRDVKLTLVSGRPISFQMDLYQPLFVPRPTVEPELFASLRPPTYAGSLVTAGQGGFTGAPIAGAFGGGMMLGNIGGFGGGMGMMGMGGAGGGNGRPGWPNAPGEDPDPNANPQLKPQPSAVSPVLGLNRYLLNPANALQGNPKLTYKDLQQRRESIREEEMARAKQVGNTLTATDPDLIESAVEQLGDPARFSIEERVTLPRQQSAMLPILDQSIEAARVSIFNEQVQNKHPLQGLRIKNNSKQSLMQGPIAVYDDGQYAGDARILDLQPGEERFVSFAIDIGVEVASHQAVVPASELSLRMGNGNQRVRFTTRSTRTYVITNRTPENRKVVIEHPVRNDWRLVEARKLLPIPAPAKDALGNEKAPAWKAGPVEQPFERTNEFDRFNVEVKSGETVKYNVSEEQPRVDTFHSIPQADTSGFATALDLDIWTHVKRTPEDTFGLEVVNNNLKVIHNDRRTTTYSIRNRADEERTVWLEHIVPDGRRLIGDVKPDVDDVHRYCFKLVLPPGKMLSQTVVEEFEIAQPEAILLRTSAAATKGANSAANNLPAERFITELGFEVWVTRQMQPDALMSARFIKGELHTSTQNREHVIYHIRNASGEERTFRIDHHVRPQWSFVGEQKPIEGSSTCYRILVKSRANQAVKQEIAEEKLALRKETLGELTEDRVKALVSSAKIGDGVKESIKRGTSMLRALATTEMQLKESRARLKEITEEQARIKGNLEKLPANSDLYKRLMDKFDKQETALEKAQNDITERSALEKSQQKELAGFLEKLNVE